MLERRGENRSGGVRRRREGEETGERDRGNEGARERGNEGKRVRGREGKYERTCGRGANIEEELRRGRKGEAK